MLIACQLYDHLLALLTSDVTVIAVLQQALYQVLANCVEGLSFELIHLVHVDFEARYLG